MYLGDCRKHGWMFSNIQEWGVCEGTKRRLVDAIFGYFGVILKKLDIDPDEILRRLEGV